MEGLCCHACATISLRVHAADVAPNLHDPVMLSLLAGTLVVYSALSTHCVLSLKPPTDDSTEDGGDDKGQDINAAGCMQPHVSGGIIRSSPVRRDLGHSIKYYT